MATASTGFCQTDNYLLEVSSWWSRRGVGVLPAIAFTGLLCLAGGVHAEFLQFLRPRSRAQLRLLHGDPGRAASSRSFCRARRGHGGRWPAGSRAPGGGGQGPGRTVRGRGRQCWGPDPTSLSHAAPTVTRSRQGPRGRRWRSRDPPPSAAALRPPRPRRARPPAIAGPRASPGG